MFSKYFRRFLWGCPKYLTCAGTDISHGCRLSANQDELVLAPEYSLITKVTLETYFLTQASGTDRLKGGTTPPFAFCTYRLDNGGYATYKTNFKVVVSTVNKDNQWKADGLGGGYLCGNKESEISPAKCGFTPPADLAQR